MNHTQSVPGMRMVLCHRFSQNPAFFQKSVIPVKIPLMVFVLFVMQSAFCQETIKSDYFSNHQPRKPETSSLGNFGNTPVNLFTGLPEVSLQLMVLPGRKISVPVSLNYDATGLKSDDLSGSTGIKWSMNAGGYVIRKMNGLPDEDYQEGYLKNAALTNYYSLPDTASWAVWSERNEKDTAPDEFAVFINGRTIRFVFDKNNTAHTIPRSAVKISYKTAYPVNTTNHRIISLEVITEDGLKYSFGSVPEAIEERKVETLIVRSYFNEKTLRACPKPSDPFPTGYDSRINSYDCKGQFFQSYNPNVALEVKTSVYNSKWHLVSITAPEGEATTFRYTKLKDLVYSTRPNIVKVAPVTFSLPFFEHRWKEPDDPFGLSHSEFVDHFFNQPVIMKFTDPGEPGAPAGYVYDPVRPNNYPPYLKPSDYTPNGGALNSYHTLITESNVQLTEIISGTGNRITFLASGRADLPGAIKYDVISLYNMQARLIKSVKLNYTVHNSRLDKEHYWFTEALVMKELSSYKEVKREYYAPDIFLYRADEVKNATLRKYVFEGMQEYNYKRTFLSSIEDITNPLIKSSLYDFSYHKPESLRRRTTPHHDMYGYFTDLTPISGFTFADRQYAKCSSGGGPSTTEPELGMLNKIRYPTGGSTEFVFSTQLRETKIAAIRDLDEKNAVVYQREFEYQLFRLYPIVMTSYQEYKLPKSADWTKYIITSSSPQNESFSTNHGVNFTSRATTVYHGGKSNNTGFELFTYSYHHDAAYNDYVTRIYSSPAEKPASQSLSNIFPYPKNTERDHVRGLLLKHQVFKKGANPGVAGAALSETEYTYQINPYGYKPPVITGLKGGSYARTSKEEVNFWYGNVSGPVLQYRWGRYKIIPDWVVLASEKHTRPDEANPVNRQTIVTEYKYDPVFLQETENIRFLANDPGRKIITETKYATHTSYNFSSTNPDACYSSFTSCQSGCATSYYPSQCYSSCQTNYQSCLSRVGTFNSIAITNLRLTNQITVPIEKRVWVEEPGKRILQQATVFRFSTENTRNVAVLRDVWELKKPLLPHQYTESSLSANGAFVYDAGMRKVHSNDAFEPNSLVLLSQTGIDGSSHAYTWDHNNSIVRESVRNPGQYQFSESFQNIPLVGPERITDPNNISTYFRFDRNNRLAYMLDNDSNIRNRYRYHYALDAEKEKLTASITINGSRTTGTQLSFDANYEVRDFGDITYTWDFGNGVSKSVNTYSTTYSYPAAGTFTVRLRKSHPDFGTAEASAVITITPSMAVSICVDGPFLIALPPATMSPIAGDCTTQPMNPSVTNLKATVSGGCAPLTYRWQYQIGNGSWMNFGSNSATVSAPYEFASRFPGSYNVQCIVTDGCGKATSSNIKNLVIL